jgi:hypothetical protein
MEKLLVGDGIDMTRNLARAFMVKSWWRVKKSSGRDSVTGK